MQEAQKETRKALLWAEGIKYEKEMNKKKRKQPLSFLLGAGVELSVIILSGYDS